MNLPSDDKFLHFWFPNKHYENNNALNTVNDGKCEEDL